MTVEAFGLLLAFLGLLALPLVPGLRELWRPRDDRPMEIDETATRAPRDEPARLRQALRPAGAGPGAGGAPDVLAEWRVPAGAEAAPRVLALGDAEVADGARLGEAYVQGRARLGAGVRLRALAADGDCVLGPDCVVEQWIDTEGTAWVGPRCRLGRSASAARSFHLSAGCAFRRLWGLPITVDAGTPAAGAPPPPTVEPRDGTIEDRIVWAGRRLALPSGLCLDRDLVVHGELRIGPGAVIRGSVKAHGPVHVGEAARIEGSLIGRGAVHIAGGARIGGSIHAEGDVAIGPETRIGRPDGFKTVYAAGRVTLAPDVLVFGSIVAEQGGTVA